MEMAIALDPLVEQVMVVGEGRHYLTALMVLNSELWPSLAEEVGLNPSDEKSLADSRLQNEILKRTRPALKDFPGYAKVRRVALFLEPWSVENGLLTPTLKVKRQQVLERHAASVESLYLDNAPN
jgi:long-chain acyl-CoA synthetase